MTDFNTFKAKLDGIFFESPYEDCSDILAQKLWKLKDAKFIRTDKDVKDKALDNMNVCTTLLKLKEGRAEDFQISVKYIEAGKKHNKTFSPYNGVEKLLENEIEQRGLNLKNLTFDDVGTLILQDEEWFTDLLNHKIVTDYGHNSEDNTPNDLLNEIISIIEENGGNLEQTLNTKYHTNDIIVAIKTIINLWINNENTSQWEDYIFEIITKTYLYSHPNCTYAPITINLLKDIINELREESKLDFNFYNLQKAKAAIAVLLFYHKGHIEPGLPSIPLKIKKKEFKYIKNALKAVGIITVNSKKAQETGGRERDDKPVYEALKVLKNQILSWDEDENLIFHPLYI